MRKLIVIALCMNMGGAVGLLWARGPGKSGAIVLEHSVGARASSMAGAYSSIGGDITAMYYNPAGLVSVPEKEASFSYQRGFADDSYMTFVYGQKFLWGVLAGAVCYSSGGEMEMINLAGEEWTAQAKKDIVGIISYGRKFGEKLSLGMNLKIVSSTLVEQETATALALDIGSILTPRWEGLKVGIAIRNLGTDLRFLEKGDPLPLTISPGASYEKAFGNKKILFSFDLPYLAYEAILVPAIGFELDWQGIIQWRGGYQFNIDDTGLTLGAGFTYANFSVDYALRLADRMDNAHGVSLGVKF